MREMQHIFASESLSDDIKIIQTMSNDSLQLDTARIVLLASPPGQFDTLVQDFQTLFAASGESLTDELVAQVRAEYQSLRTNLTCSDETTELSKRLKEYQSDYYSSKRIVTALSVMEEGDTTVIRTYAERIDAENCHAGSWTGHWTVASSGEVKGSVQVQAFSYEDGTVRLDKTQEFGPKQGDVVECIQECEQETMNSLDELYDTMGERLKALRRVMPVTRTKMNWNVQSHRMVKLLEETKE